jgi:hypothetical protein
VAEKTRGVWGKPELILVTRHRPEETVLVACKTGTKAGGSSPLNTQISCEYYGLATCYSCEAPTFS